MAANTTQSTVPKGIVTALSIWMFLSTLFLIFGLVHVWPEATDAMPIGALDPKDVQASPAPVAATQKPAEEVLKALKEQQRTTILLILLLGALGAQIHAVQSFADFVGNGSFHTSWAFWHLKRPLIGALVALTSYSAIVG